MIPAAQPGPIERPPAGSRTTCPRAPTAGWKDLLRTPSSPKTESIRSRPAPGAALADAQGDERSAIDGRREDGAAVVVQVPAEHVDAARGEEGPHALSPSAEPREEFAAVGRRLSTSPRVGRASRIGVGSAMGRDMVEQRRAAQIYEVGQPPRERERRLPGACSGEGHAHARPRAKVCEPDPADRTEDGADGAGPHHPMTPSRRRTNRPGSRKGLLACALLLTLSSCAQLTVQRDTETSGTFTSFRALHHVPLVGDSAVGDPDRPRERGRTQASRTSRPPR